VAENVKKMAAEAQKKEDDLGLDELVKEAIDAADEHLVALESLRPANRPGRLKSLALAGKVMWRKR
jgi:hypothetical protein